MQVARAAGLGSGPGEPLAAKGLHSNDGADHAAVDIAIADSQPREDVAHGFVDSALNAEGQAVAGCGDLVEHRVELVVGDPALIATDVGPIIDAAALQNLELHAQRMLREGKLLYQCPLPAGTEHGTFFAPCAFEIDGAARLRAEVFGPILHVVRWPADRFDAVLDEIAATGYGLTLGIQSRIDETVRYILARLHVGNAYVNRNMIGAVVGVQPFGGEGLSGTGPKAGGPRYLHRFATERTLSVDTTAAGGNASLLSLQDDT